MAGREHSDRDREKVTNAIRNAETLGKPCGIHEISIATGLEYGRVVSIVMQGLSSLQYRLAVNDAASGSTRPSKVTTINKPRDSRPTRGRARS